MPAYGALNGSFAANTNLNKPEDNGFMKIGDIKGADFMGELESFGTTPAGGVSANLDTLVNPDDFNINDELIENPGINDAVRDGIDIERMTGIGFHENLHANDYWSAAAAIDLISQGANNGMVGLLHWTDFAVGGTASNIVKAAGVVNETYECTSIGMTNAWNQNEQRYEGVESMKGIGDLNGDGSTGDAPLGDGCDGDPSLLSKAWDAIVDWWNSDDDDDADGCFDMPWLDERYMIGAGTESYMQNFNDLSDQMQASAFGYAQQDTSFHNMPVI